MYRFKNIHRPLAQYSQFLRNFALETVEKLEVDKPHIPVMKDEVLSYLKPTGLILDGTFGAGGHSRAILESSPTCKILALDRDPIGIQYAEELSKEFPGRVIPLQGKFSDLPVLFQQHNIKRNSLDGVLFDFGCSSMQFDTADRGFSISKNGPLDMRMTPTPGEPTAADVLASVTEEDLYKILKYYGEEKHARKIARGIIEARYLFKRLNTTQELADLVQSCYAEDVYLKDKLQRPSHVATKTFQALRIFVNNELNEINYGMIMAAHYLKIAGRLVTITFHSLEDTIVKRHISGNVVANTANPLPLKYMSSTLQIDDEVVQEAMDSNWKMLHKHVILPEFQEVEDNPRSRSAKMRAAVKIQ